MSALLTSQERRFAQFTSFATVAFIIVRYMDKWLKKWLLSIDQLEARTTPLPSDVRNLEVSSTGVGASRSVLQD